jgi:glucokinase
MEKFVLGIDIGGTNSKVGLIDESGSIAFREIFPTKSEESFDIYLPRLKEIVDKLLTITGKVPIGIGVGAPNANFLTGMVHEPPNLSWGSVDLKKRFEELFKLPTFVDNDANLAAVSELLWGCASGVKHLLVVTLGTGVGTGIIIDGNVLQGAFGGAGEGGHIEIVPNGRACGCGGAGHLEAYASATGMKLTIKEILGSDVDLALLGTALKSGDKDALKIFGESAKYLGKGLASMATILFPEMVVLTGGVMNAGPIFLEMIRAEFEKMILDLLEEK